MKTMLTVNQRRALQALFVEPTREAAARAAGIAPRTLRAYFHDSEFRSEYERMSASVLDDVTRRLKVMLPGGLDALRDLIESEETSDATRHAAIRTVLEYGLRYVELNEVEQRLDRLERALK